MTTALAAITAALATLVVVLFVLLLLRRPRAAGNPRGQREQLPQHANSVTPPPASSAPQAPALADPRMQQRMQELSEALDRAEQENRRNRFIKQLAGALDLDDVLARTLAAAHDLPAVDAAMIVLQQEDGGPLVATQGMSRDEALNQPMAPPAEGRAPRAVSLNYRYGEGDAGRDGNLIRGGLMVPLLGTRADVVGTLAVFWRGREREAAGDEIGQLEELASSAGPTIENAKRFLEARQLAELDALTGLHNRRYFDDVLDREVSRAHRYGRSLALILVDFDDLKAINDRVGHLGGDAALAELGERVRDSLRSADIACRIGGDEFAVILPESALEDARQLFDRLLAAIGTRPLAGGESGSVSGGIAALERDDDPKTLFQRADEALYRAKRDGKGRAR